MLLLVFAYAISWVFAWVGLLVPSPEVINNASFIVIFPLTFLANTFVPLDTLPGPVRVFAEWNPISAVTQAARDLFGNPDPDPLAAAPTAWPLQNPELYTVLWSVAVLLVFVPLLASADAAFAALVATVTPTFDADWLARWAVLFGLGAGATAGAAFLLLAPPEPAAPTHRPTRLPCLDWAIPTGLLVAVFAVFVAVHFVALFGPADHVVRTTGLT